MSFSQNSKLEIINKNLEKKIDAKIFFFSLFISCGYFENENFVLLLDTSELLPLLENLFERLNITSNIQERIKTKIGFKEYFKIDIKKEELEKLNIDLKQINAEDFSSVDQIKSFVIGAFLGAATSSIKISERPEEKTTSGYHLEFDSKNEEFLKTLQSLLKNFEINGKIIKRKNTFVLYIKDAENVSDTLALVGASDSVLTLQNEIVKREFRNKINRQTNCESGNISKMVSASMKQIEAIEKIERKIGLDSLSEDLQEVALLRLANPEESLADLLKLSTLNLTKSGLNHRLRKLIIIAYNLT
ncbi:MAG: DNA-binding protein WhiA [Clostridia bacterium]|nr:DNA-binding protein WhiA [Clostridia bacterium]